MRVRIRGGRIIDPGNSLDRTADLYVEHGRVAAIGRAPKDFKTRREIDARGLIVCPGFVELGARLGEPGFEHKATIASESHAAAASGFTTVCCLPDTEPVIDNPAVVELINQRAERADGARILCLGALTLGLRGEVLSEMHALKDIGCVGVTNAQRAIHDTAALQHALAYAASVGLTVFLDPEEPWLAREGHMHEGATSTRLGISGIPAAAEQIALSRDLVLVEQTGVRAHFCRLSSATSIKLIADARRSGLPVSADVGLLNLLLTDKDVGAYDSNCHLRPPLRTARDRSRLRNGLARGVIDAVCAHHQPHDADAKAAPFGETEPGASTFDCFLAGLLSLVGTGGLDLSSVIGAASLAPSRILGLESGTLTPGAPADICIFDADFRWDVEIDSIKSAGKNSPFVGTSVRGKTMMTLVNGRVVYDALK